MRRRRQRTTQEDETELIRLLDHEEYDEGQSSSEAETSPCEASEFTCSADPNKECRFILLGGDDYAKHEACRIILRNQQSKQKSDSKGWEVKENHVQERLVTVAITPYFWLERLRTFFFFSRRLKKMKNDIKKCVSEVFPGPNAFLLVIRDSFDLRKEQNLLKAVASVFGKEVLEYTMVLLIKGAEQNCSIPPKMRHYFLEDSDESVQELFELVLKMVEEEKPKFFIPSAYADFMKTDFESWEKKRISNMNAFLAKCLNEKDQLIEEIRNELAASQVANDELKTELDTSRSKESTLKKDLEVKEDQLKQLKQLKDYASENSKLRKDLDTSKSKEQNLRNQCDALNIRETELKTMLEASKQGESELEKKLEVCQQRARECE